ncbi:MAG: hypothetical protein R3281_04960 [Balneolaceae bacterium]|nr:hypothetical protein [Balneolaceae bacterium]
MHHVQFLSILCMLYFSLGTVKTVSGQTQEPDPLSKFEQFIGGEWEMDGSVQVYEWGVGKQSIRARSYSVNGSERNLVAEGTWYWHPATKQIRGIFTAVNMPFTLLEYRSEFRDNSTLVSTFTAYDSSGTTATYRELMWTQNDSTYLWELWQNSDGSEQKIMDGLLTRVWRESK